MGNARHHKFPDTNERVVRAFYDECGGRARLGARLRVR